MASSEESTLEEYYASVVRGRMTKGIEDTGKVEAEKHYLHLIKLLQQYSILVLVK